MTRRNKDAKGPQPLVHLHVTESHMLTLSAEFVEKAVRQRMVEQGIAPPPKGARIEGSQPEDGGFGGLTFCWTSCHEGGVPTRDEQMASDAGERP